MDRRFRETLSATWARLRADRVLYATIAFYTLLGGLFLVSNNLTDRAAYDIYVSKWWKLYLVLFPAIAVGYDTIMVIHRFDARRPLAFSRRFSPDRLGHLIGGTILSIALFFHQGTFTSLKNAMFAWRGEFAFDRVQADIDMVLHFGVDPWRLVKPLVANDMLRSIVEFNYNIVWFIVGFGVLYFVTTSPRADRIRVRYLMAFFLVWVVLGNLLASAYLSAGPAFYGAVTGDSARFAELVGYIAQGKDGANSAHAYQAYLWMLHERGLSGFGSGISAFPSVHVGMMAMIALFAFEIRRGLGVAMSLYTAFVMASSVALGWHYAIDGYVSVAFVIAAHYALKRLFPDRPRMRSPALVPATVS